MEFTESEFNHARWNLSSFVCTKAQQMERRFALSWRPDPRAPETLPEMQRAYRHCIIHATPFPIWDGASDDTIYISANDNYAFRFWHDMLHLALYAETILVDEVELGHIHVGCVMAQFGMHSLEAAMMRADTIEQSKYEAEHGHFPVNQLAFVKECVRNM